MGSSSSSPILTKESQAILTEVQKHPVVMYTKDHCPYCVKAKNDLQQDGISYVEKNLNEIGESTAKGLIELTHCKTVPQIFICGKFIGGYTDMHSRRKDLMSMIEQCSSNGNIIDKTPSNSINSRI